MSCIGRQAAAQGEGEGFGDFEVDHLVDEVRAAGEVDDAVVGGAGLELVGVFFGNAFNQAALHGAEHGLVDAGGFGFDDFVESFEAAHFFGVRGVVRQVGGRCAGAGAVNKHEAQIEGDVFNEFQGLLELALGFAGEADDKVAAQAQIGADGAQFADDGFVFQRGVAAFHGGEHAVAAALDGQVQVGNEFGQVAVAFDDGVGEFARVAGGEAQAFDAGDFVHDAQQGGEVADAAVVHCAAIGVDVLSEQVDFFYALLCEAGDFGEHVVQGAGKFFAACVGDDAEGAVFGTAFHNGNERAATFDAGGGQVVEFFDFGKGDVHLCVAAGFLIRNHFGEAVQGLRAKDDIDIGGAFDDVFAFLRGDASGYANDKFGILFFQGFDAAEVGKHFFLRFFAHRAGVEEDDVGVVRLGHLFNAAVFFFQYGQHFFAVVFVHLAAKGADKDFFHGLCSQTVRTPACNGC